MVSRCPQRRLASAIMACAYGASVRDRQPEGGAGKTTTTLNLGAYLAAAGKRVLIVNLDPQANATSGLGIDHRSITAGLYEVLTGDHSAQDVRIKTPHEGLHLLPTGQNLAGSKHRVGGARASRVSAGAVLGSHCWRVRLRAIDCPPSLASLPSTDWWPPTRSSFPCKPSTTRWRGSGQLLHHPFGEGESETGVGRLWRCHHHV